MTKLSSLPKNRTNAQRAYEEVRDMVVNFKLLPSQNINELGLAKDLGLSRRTIREALNRLMMEDFLHFTPNKGFVTRALDVDEIVDLYEVRLAIEVAAMKFACKRAKDADISDLKIFWRQIGRQYKKMTVAEIADADEEFHRRLARMSGNKEIEHSIDKIAARIRFCRMIDLEIRTRRNPLYDEHEDILAALESRNVTQGVKALTAHIDMSGEKVVEVIKEGLARIYLHHSDRSSHLI